MIFILEGVYKCGKTTLSERLIKRFKAEYVKFSAPTKPPYQEYNEFLDRVDPNKCYVLDRFCHGELVYGPVYRGKSGLNLWQLFYLELRLKAFNAVVIYCEIPSMLIRSNFNKDKEKITRPEDIERLLESYDKVWNHSLIKPLRYDYTEDVTAGELLGQLDQLHFKSKTFFQDSSQYKNYIGSTSPDVVFVGDRKNPKRSHLPIFDSLSGYFLLKSCFVRLDLNKVGFCNSIGEGGDIVSYDFIKWLKPRKLVCLGKLSYDRMSSIMDEDGEFLKVPAVEVPHPQYAKRFLGKQALTKYACQLAEAANA